MGLRKLLKMMVLVGTRPEIIKMQPVIKEIERRNELELCFIHTGQHYAWPMSTGLMEELELPEPKYFLSVGSGSHGEQTARIISRLEPVIKKNNPDIVLVEGDTNSALGGALTAAKLGLTVAHIEAGCRSFDRSMPEEINRILIDDLASFHFAPTSTCVANLLNEGISRRSIFMTGHTIIDLLDYMEERMKSPEILRRFDIEPREFYFATVHRDSNVDRKENLASILQALSQIGQKRPVIFPAHPRTMKRIKQFQLLRFLGNVKLMEPLSLTSTLTLIARAKLVLTDSGGIQQEALLLGTPCITLRNTTEWVETVQLGVNFLTGSDMDFIVNAVKDVENNFDMIQGKFANAKNVYGDLGVTKRILDILMKYK